MDQTRNAANEALDRFVRVYQDKYPKVIEILIRDCEELLEFYDYPAVHRQTLRTINPIESNVCNHPSPNQTLESRSEQSHHAERDVQAGAMCPE